MRAYLLLLISFSLIMACTTTSKPINILERGFGKNFDDREGIIFYEGPWYAPRSEFGFQILNGVYRESLISETGKIESYEIVISNCSLNRP